jgi:hypothetical protein
MNMEQLKVARCLDSQLIVFEAQFKVETLLLEGGFGELESIYKQWCTGVDRLPDGRWHLSVYADGIIGNLRAWKTWDRGLVAIQAWQQAHPDSEAARYVEAVYWSEFAWVARGSGFASSVSQEAWALFRERVQRALAAIVKLPHDEPVCAAPYALMINLMLETGQKGPELRALYARAAKRFPEYHPIHFAMARTFEPRWGGSAAAFERFADEAATLTRSFEGRGMYARIYWTVDDRYGLPFDARSGRPPHWEKLKQGFEDLLKRYPQSTHNLGQYANVACRSTDSATYRRLRTMIDGFERDIQMAEAPEVCDRRHGWTGPK